MNKKFVWLCRNNVHLPPDSFRYSYANQKGSWEFLVDRFGLLEEPDVYDCANVLRDPVYDLNNLSCDWEDRFYSIFDSVAENIYQTAGSRKIILMYSGGIDSACVLVALLKHPQFNEFLQSGRFAISMTSQSIDEYPLLFWQHIVPRKIPLIAMNYDEHLSQDALVVTGDFGDHLISSNELSVMTNGTEIGSGGWSVLKSFISRKDSNGQLARTYETAIKRAPFKLETAHQIQWWFSNAFVLQADLVSPYIWSTVQDLSTLPTNDKVYRFFYHDAFTTFSFEYMSTNPRFETLDAGRLWFKKYVVDFTKDPQYLNKQKTWNQRLTMRTIHKTEIRGDLSWDFNAKIYEPCV